MIIATDEYQVNVEKAPNSPYFEVKSLKDGSLELLLHVLELCLFEEFQTYEEILASRTTTSIFLTPEALSQWFSFEVLNYGAQL